MKVVKRRVKTRSGHYFGLQLDWNLQLFAFLKLQLKAEMEWNKNELARQSTDPITPYRSRMELALQVAKSAGWSKSVAQRILNHEVQYIRHGKLPVLKQGKHSKTASWISDEGTILAMREYMAEAGEGKSLVIVPVFVLYITLFQSLNYRLIDFSVAMDSIGLATAITNYWRNKYPGTAGQEPEQAQLYTIGGIQRRIKKALSSRSARAWLAKLGWNWKEVRKAIYKDGHERPDVQEYRQNVFLPRMAAFKSRMMEWDEDLQPIVKELGEGEKPLVFITHDESTFNSNDGRK